MTEPFKRKHYALVNRTYQYRFLAFTLSYMIIVVFFMAFFVFVPEFMQMTNPHASIEIQNMAAEKILWGHTKMWPILILLIALIGLHSFRVFLRFVGPLYRFTVAFDQIRDGNLGFRVILREGDYLTDEKDQLNDMMDGISERIEGARTAGAEARWALERVEKLAVDSPLAEGIEELKSRLTGIDAALARFVLMEKTPADS